jgi:hypothetical protein
LLRFENLSVADALLRHAFRAADQTMPRDEPEITATVPLGPNNDIALLFQNVGLGFLWIRTKPIVRKT